MLSPMNKFPYNFLLNLKGIMTKLIGLARKNTTKKYAF